MEILAQPSQELSTLDSDYLALAEENALLRKEIQVARKAAELTANLVVKQFEETEKVLHRFQVANAQRKAVLDSATQISIIATNRDGVITVFNTGAENLLGYQAQDMIGKKTPELFHLQSELEIVGHSLSFKHGGRVTGLEVFFKYAIQGKLTQSEWTYVRKDGTQFPVRMTINVLRNPDGDISGLLFIAMDTAEIKRSEKALKESERNYRLLIRNLPNCVYKGYLDGSIDFFDNKIEQITGYSKEEFLSRKKNWFSLVHEDDLEYAKEKFKLALRTDSSYIREYRMKSKSGDTIWIQDGGQIIYGENGEVEFITGAFLDIGERKLAEKALHESEEKYRSLFDSGPDPIFVLDRSTLEILDANPMSEDTYRYSKGELTGMRFSMLGPVDDILKGISNFKKNDWPKVCIVSSRVQHYRKDNKPFYVRVTACPTRYKDRDAIILATTDITEMLEKEAQLLQASKMTGLGEMSTGVAHELNQPLNAIKMGSEYLMMMVENQKKISEENLVEVAKQISEQVDRASEIMDRLREFGHLPDFAKEKVDINKAVRVAYGIAGQQLRLQNIEVAIDLEEKLPPILAHNTRMEQVIFNLVTNAQDAVNQKKKAGLDAGKPAITIRSFVENDRVALTFSDNGIGIPKDVLDKVFEPFFTTKQVGKGLGLGLSITYGIVKDYNGEIEIQSEEGMGTTVKMTFPRAPA
jgi:PAS domain S-box-containing protein